MVLDYLPTYLLVQHVSYTEPMSAIDLKIHSLQGRIFFVVKTHAREMTKSPFGHWPDMKVKGPR